MDNEKGKSLISKGSSNLAKTEKLLSITQKILSEIKPQYESIKIGNQEWMTRNLDVDRFRNGDLIPHIKSDKEWKKAGINGQPAWCYYDNDPENGKKYGKLYNWFAVNGSRRLAPNGWHVPTDEEWTSLVEYLGGEDVAGDKMKTEEGWEEYYDDGIKESFTGFEQTIINNDGNNSSGFTGIPGGERSNSFYFLFLGSYWWSSSENYDNALILQLCGSHSRVYKFDSDKKYGYSVRCLKDSSDSKWAKAIRAGNIKPYLPPGLKLK